MHDAVNTYLEEKTQLAEVFLGSGDVASYLKGHTDALERALLTLRDACCIDPRIALLATGGFARRELFPFSDIDIALLTPEGLEESQKARLSLFVTTLWDLGLTVGASVRTREETLSEAESDVTVATNFLESRLIAGDTALYETTHEAFLATLNPKRFFRDKVLEMQQRHKKHADTPYELEPDVKESLGGLRDIQVPLWCARAAGWGDSPEALVESALVTKHEARALKEALQFLSEVRLRLQLMSGRHEDRLVFDKQSALAEAMHIDSERQLDRAETLMQRYYRNAKNVVLLNAIAMRSLEERLFADATHDTQDALALGAGFIARASTLDIEDDSLFVTHPQALVECFLVFAEHRELKDFSVRLMRSLYRDAALADSNFLKNDTNKALFLKILKLHYGCYTSFKAMNRWGILGSIIPQFDRIVGQMQHDLFHAYTVDQHTLKAIKYIRHFAHSAYAHEFPLLTELMASYEKPWLLTLAALFHDIGKGQGGRHELLGEQAVGSFARDLGLSPEESDHVRFLVREHLSMSTVAQKEDLGEPETIVRFARRVGTLEHLNGLYLLTHADIRATSPKIWNSWKAQLLEELYCKTKAVLVGEDASRVGDSLVEEKRVAATRLLQEALPAEALERFYAERDLTYFLRNSVDDIAWHAELVARDLRPAKPVIELRQASGSLLKLFVYLPDAKELFSRLVCAFERTGLSVLDARVHTSSSGWALDTFLLEDKRSHPDFEAFSKSFAASLAEDFLLARPLPQTKTGRLSRRSRSFPVKPLIDIDEDASGKGALLKVTCSDRLGLLYAISLCLTRHAINLVSAKIATLGERVEDIFLIEGDALKVPENVLALESELLRVVSDVK